MMRAIPHPIPYQGSKRKLAPSIANYVPQKVETLYEPFAGSAAFTLYAAYHNLSDKFVIGDALEPLVRLWRIIVSDPYLVTEKYESLWKTQKNRNNRYFYDIRSEYNECKDPVMLLYLIARCVKNAVRFSKDGRFTQSADKRRLGMHPDKMKLAVEGASKLLHGRVKFFSGDFAECILGATPEDLIYLDPPYQGTTYGRDKRYYQQLEIERLIDALTRLNELDIPFILSYDGKHGEKEYGIALPDKLNANRILLEAGRSSQATLNGNSTLTIESLYLSHQLSRRNKSPVRSPSFEQLPLFI